MMTDILECAAWAMLLIFAIYGLAHFFKAVDKALDDQKAEYEKEWKHGW